jgi:hypothetical protein
MQFSAVFCSIDDRQMRASNVHLSVSADAVIEPNERCASFHGFAVQTHQTMADSASCIGFDGCGPDATG